MLSHSAQKLIESALKRAEAMEACADTHQTGWLVAEQGKRLRQTALSTEQTLCQDHGVTNGHHKDWFEAIRNRSLRELRISYNTAGHVLGQFYEGFERN